MKKTLSMVSLAVATAAAFYAGDALAVQFFEASQQKSAQIFVDTKQVIYIVGAFGLMVIAVGAIFGKLAWKHLAFLGIGLLILAGAGGIVDYVVGDSSFTLAGKGDKQLHDTLGGESTVLEAKPVDGISPEQAQKIPEAKPVN